MAPTALSNASAEYSRGYVIADKYILEDEIGGGGMGVVWRACNTALDCSVAIKLIRSEIGRDVLSHRLLQEARAAARLGHPAIARVFDLGETENGDPFLVMELLHGKNLGHLIQSGPLPATRVVQLLLPIADALSLAHAKGMVHRDLKPDNIFITEHEGQIQPKLLDFGIVKLQEHAGARQLTHCGTILGSPEYMSPEQARGVADIDFRSDIWSFCVALYEAISGKLPFHGPNYNAILRSVVDNEPERIADAHCDPELWWIIERGLAKDRSQRYRSMGELGRALAEWLAGCGVHEDACGTSLEAKWMSMPSDPMLRISASWRFDDGGPRSGVRGISDHDRRMPSDFSISQPAPNKPAKRRHSQGLVWSLLVAFAAAAGVGFWLRASQTELPRPGPASRLGTSVPSPARTAEQLIAPATDRPVVAPIAEETLTAPEAQPAAASNNDLLPSAKRPVKARARKAALPAKDPAGDLIQAY